MNVSYLRHHSTWGRIRTGCRSIIHLARLCILCVPTVNPAADLNRLRWPRRVWLLQRTTEDVRNTSEKDGEPMRARAWVPHLLGSRGRKRAEPRPRGGGPLAQSPLPTSSEANDGLGPGQVSWVKKCPSHPKPPPCSSGNTECDLSWREGLCRWDYVRLF